MSVSKSDLKFYYTAISPLSAQSDQSQSIGGYPSISEYGKTAKLASDMTVSATSLVSDVVLGSGSALIDDEIMIAQGNSTTLSVLQRGVNGTSAKPHVSGEPVYLMPSKSPLNNVFSDDLKQYLCFAVKNVNTNSVFYDLSFYIKQPPLSANTAINLAVEVPKATYLTSTIRGGSIISVVDTSLSYDDNFFVNCVLTVTSGININQSRTIISSDKSTYTIVLDSALPFAAEAGASYSIQPSPAQRISAGNISPIFNTNYVSQLSSAINPNNAISINFSGIRTNGIDLHPNEIVYLWIQRSLSQNSEAFLSDRCLFTARYRTS